MAAHKKKTSNRKMPTLEQVQQHLAVNSNEPIKVVADLLGCSTAWLSNFMKENGLTHTSPVKTNVSELTTPGHSPFLMKMKPFVPLHPVEVRQATPEEIEDLEKIPRPDHKKSDFVIGKRRFW